MTYANEIFFFWKADKFPYLGIYNFFHFEYFQLVQILTQYKERNFRNTVGVCANDFEKKKAMSSCALVFWLRNLG